MDLNKSKEIYNKIIANKNFVFYLLVLTIIVLFFVYDYHEIINKQPQSVHSWRQSDCSSQALNYANRDYNFFKVQLHGQISDNYQTGYSAEEFPIVFYFVGTLYKVFGYHEFIYRLVTLSIFIIGLFFLYKLYFITIKDKYWSLLFTVFLFTIPVLVFYANNYLTNAPAFGITLIAWYFFFVFCETKNQKHFRISILLLTIAALLKISELLSLFTIIGIVFLDYFKIIKFKENNKLFSKHHILGLFLFVSLVLVYLWYHYTHYYNSLHSQNYYGYGIRDYFSTSEEEKNLVINYIVDYWNLAYQNKIALYFYGFTLLINILFINKVDKLLMSITTIMFIGTCLFVLLFFRFLGYHDYYVISLYSTVIFSTITFLQLLIKNYEFIINSNKAKIIFFIFLIYCIHYTDVFMKKRYYGWENDNMMKKCGIYEIKPYLDNIGVSKDDKIISIPDVTPNLSLYLMDRLGWTNYIILDNSKLIPFAIERGAKYLIINNPAVLNDGAVKPYLYHKIGEFQNVFVYKLDNVVDNSFDNESIKEKLFWNMERISDNRAFVISDTLNKTISSNFICTDKAYSGLNSIRVSPNSYSLNYLEENLIENQKYVVRIKKYSKNSNPSSLLVCISSPEEFYLSVNQESKIDSSDWKIIEVQYRVPNKIKNRKMSIDFFNSGKEDVFLDDFSVIKYE